MAPQPHFIRARGWHPNHFSLEHGGGTPNILHSSTGVGVTQIYYQQTHILLPQNTTKFHYTQKSIYFHNFSIQNTSQYTKILSSLHYLQFLNFIILSTKKLSFPKISYKLNFILKTR
jgi:hypothetical protein